jgi:HSP20 family protein
VDRDALGLHPGEPALTISAERHSAYEEGHALLAQERFDGAVNRRLRVPDWVEAERVSTEYADGVLTITLPMAEKARPRHISIAACRGPSALGDSA